MHAVIMTGGQGTRLHPLTTRHPKPMIPIVNRPLLERTINLLKQSGIREVIATLQYLPNVKLSVLHGDLPSFCMAKQVISVSWELRGRIMRSLIEEFRDHQIDTIDGLKIFYDDNWALIHPSSEEPVTNLLTEAPNKEVADNLIQEYSNRIRELMK